MEIKDLVDRLKAWARRYEPRSQERTLFLAAAAELENRPVVYEEGLTVDAVEKAIGSPLLKWQRDRLEKRQQEKAP